ncbi:FAD-binding domain-containing protein [Sandarakinorhabdus sp. DWP1-3-1]|uniref:FAD-binding domain-containing protein n=1 Tax=Sandarakinorhabdus sp. DWP1-3-1 TaxID=2804627 RepID=UPI003CFA7BF3
MTTLFPPGRAAGLDRLADFVPRAGHPYAVGRNSDPGPDAPGAVSRLSPYVRYRLVAEQEVVAAVLAEHSYAAAEKFLQEVLWRTYWKGWLELRPGVWRRFLDERDRQRDGFPAARALAAAEAGATGIDGFDDWARELVATGYLHNHARMWFASIWIFTLRLPWALGADFFLRHLIDADAASNTLSWRWVAGLQTPGKTYLATADNIARFTDGRYAPQGLAREAVALTEAPVAAAGVLPVPVAPDPRRAALLLVTPEDLQPEAVIGGGNAIAGAVVVTGDDWIWGDKARGFAGAAAVETATRVRAQFGCPVDVVATLDAPALLAAARASGATQVVTPHAPVGPVADALAQLAPALAREGVTLAQVRRSWDTQFWPHATKGFFPFRERIPALLRIMGLG